MLFGVIDLDLELSVAVPSGGPIISVGVPVSSIAVLGEPTTAALRIDGKASSRAAALTSPRSGLTLSWDPDVLPFVSTVEVILSIVTEEEEIVDVLTFASEKENSGSYVFSVGDFAGIPFSDDTVVIFKV